jgi:hypothetical protein
VFILEKFFLFSIKTEGFFESLHERKKMPDMTALVEQFLFSDEEVSSDFFEHMEFEDGSYFELDELLFTFADEFILPPTISIEETRVYCDLRRVCDWLPFLLQFEFSKYAVAARRRMDVEVLFERMEVSSS